MKTPTKYIKTLTEAEQEELRRVHKNDESSRRRRRAHVILLSFRRYAINQSADIYEVDRDRVSQWLDWWEESRFEGLDDDPRSGRPPKLTVTEQAQAIEETLKEPRLLRQGLPWLKTTFQKTVSRATLKSWLVAAGYRWQRMRRSLRTCRAEEAFREAQQTLADLRQYCSTPNREFDLWYADEAPRFRASLTPGRKSANASIWPRLTAPAKVFSACSVCNRSFILLFSRRHSTVPRLSLVSTNFALACGVPHWS